MDYKKTLIDLTARHSAQVKAAETAKENGNADEFGKALKAAQDLHHQIEDTKALIIEQELTAGNEKEFASETETEKQNKAAERGLALQEKSTVKYSVAELRAGLKSTTLASGSIAKPTAVGQMHDSLENVISSIIDEVRVVNLSGLGAINEPIEVSDMEAQGGAVASLAGTARTASDPTFTYAKISPTEVNVTSFIDRNLRRLTPVEYESRCRNAVMRSLRRKIADFIVNGDGQTSPAMYGIKNAVDYNGNALFKTLNMPSIGVDSLDEIVFSYGGNDNLGANARLYLTKTDLKAIGALRGTNEKKRLFDIEFTGNGNTGFIVNGGMRIPFTIHSSLTSLSGAERGSAPVPTMIYGDPQNYELGLFGDTDVRIDTSVKSIERMDALLGDTFVGGNLIVKNGFVVVMLPAAE
ncbi:MAG: phage major capsid protein [Oscillospiraceae bacterium]|nr:phage major capsid protein [Oscillospiraceae bacterium]MBR2366533.1 phage major capsid protein [Oscillospiraceae bacterium]MBR2977646.1 phage major capsid protein [Oscillospiraceae bacterium]MBR3850363.1 phage major capsid protein [Oscillospiraceae bacterium]